MDNSTYKTLSTTVDTLQKRIDFICKAIGIEPVAGDSTSAESSLSSMASSSESLEETSNLSGQSNVDNPISEFIETIMKLTSPSSE